MKYLYLSNLVKYITESDQLRKSTIYEFYLYITITKPVSIEFVLVCLYIRITHRYKLVIIFYRGTCTCTHCTHFTKLPHLFYLSNISV